MIPFLLTTPSRKGTVAVQIEVTVYAQCSARELMVRTGKMSRAKCPDDR
ncbi:Uncharacterised protein [Vibrio cholerae]|nr:Uncharacterised protein [Vibrio cholerae]